MPECSRIDDLVTPFVDGELAPADTTAVVAHLAACGACRARITPAPPSGCSVAPVAPPEGTQEMSEGTSVRSELVVVVNPVVIRAPLQDVAVWAFPARSEMLKPLLGAVTK